MKRLSTDVIVFSLCLMMPTINFNDEFLFKAHEINDVIFHRYLPAEFVTAKLTVPQD